MDADGPKVPKGLLAAVRYFADPDRALAFMADVRWPDGKVTCPTCGSQKVAFVASRRLWNCKAKHPKRQFSAKVGTIMEDSPIPLEKWLPAMWMLANCKNGISSYELARGLEITQKSAWFMLQRIRLAMQEGGGKLGGPGSTVEVDESWIGGTARLMNAKRRAKITRGAMHGPESGKTIVMGMLERGGRIRTRVVPNVRRKSLIPHIEQNIAKGSEIHTDAHQSYDMLGERSYQNLGEPAYEHKIVDHTFQYVAGNVHVNGVENFWSCLKRTIRGTYVSVEPFHLFRYLDEQAFRFNERKNNDRGRFVEAVKNILGRRVTYKQLTGLEAPSPA